MDAVTTPTTVADRLLAISARVRERALAAGTFDAETAELVEELARLAAIVAAVYADLRNVSDYLESMSRSAQRN